MKFKFLLVESKQDEIDFRNRINNDELVDKFLELKKKNIITGSDADMSKYENELALRTIVNLKQREYEERQASRGKDKLTATIKNGTNYIYEDDKVIILQPLNFESSYYYGKATTWCTSGRYGGNCSPNPEHWNDLKNRGEDLIFIMLKGTSETITYKNANNKQETDMHKYAIQFYEDGGDIIEIFDSVTDAPADADLPVLQEKLSDEAMDKLRQYCNIDEKLHSFLGKAYQLHGTVFDVDDKLKETDWGDYCFRVFIGNFFNEADPELRTDFMGYLQDGYEFEDYGERFFGQIHLSTDQDGLDEDNYIYREWCKPTSDNKGLICYVTSRRGDMSEEEVANKFREEFENKFYDKDVKISFTYID